MQDFWVGVYAARPWSEEGDGDLVVNFGHLVLDLAE